MVINSHWHAALGATTGRGNSLVYLNSIINLGISERGFTYVLARIYFQICGAVWSQLFRNTIMEGSSHDLANPVLTDLRLSSRDTDKLTKALRILSAQAVMWPVPRFFGREGD